MDAVATIRQQLYDDLDECINDLGGEVMAHLQGVFASGITDGPTEFEQVAWVDVAPRLQEAAEAAVVEKLRDRLDGIIPAKLLHAIANSIDLGPAVLDAAAVRDVLK